MNLFLVLFSAFYSATVDWIYFTPRTTSTSRADRTYMHNPNSTAAACSLATMVSDLSTPAQIEIRTSNNARLLSETGPATQYGNAYLQGLTPARYWDSKFSIPAQDSIAFREMFMGLCLNCASAANAAAVPTTRGSGEVVKISFHCGSLPVDTLRLQVNSFRTSSASRRSFVPIRIDSLPYLPNGRPTTNLRAITLDREGSHLRR